MGKRWMCTLLCVVAGALALSGSAFAANTTVVVNPSTPDWGSFTETPVASGTFTTLAGSGAYRFQTDGGGQLLAGAVYRGTKISDITALAFRSYSVSGAGLAVVAPSVQIGWDPDLEDGDVNTWKGRLVGVYNPTPTADQWITWDALTQFSWYFTNAAGDPAALGCTLFTPCTWTSVVAAYPDGGVSEGYYQPANTTPIGFIGLKAGSGEGMTDRYADTLAVTVGGSTTTYDFEPATTCATSTSGTTITLLADCTITSPLVIPGGYTLDGTGKTLTAADPAPGVAFIGAAVQNTTGGALTVTDLHILGASSALNCGEFTGIQILDAGGSITNTTIDNLLRGGYTGCQNGLGIRVRNSTTVTKTVVISGNTVTRYNKNGITVSGPVSATIANNTVTGAGPLGLGFAAQNGIQVSFGASAKVTGNTVTGNRYTPTKTTACGLLIYKAGGVSASKSGVSFIKAENAITGNEEDICNFGKGGSYSPAS